MSGELESTARAALAETGEDEWLGLDHGASEATASGTSLSLIDAGLKQLRPAGAKSLRSFICPRNPGV